MDSSQSASIFVKKVVFCINSLSSAILIRRGGDKMKKKEQPEKIQTDPLGSWTGVPEDPFQIPVQDADDL